MNQETKWRLEISRALNLRGILGEEIAPVMFIVAEIKRRERIGGCWKAALEFIRDDPDTKAESRAIAEEALAYMGQCEPEEE